VRATADYRSATIVPLTTRALKAVAAGEQARMWPDDPPLLSSSRQVDHTPSPKREQINDAFEITVDVNGEAVSGAGGASSTLLDWIRDHARASDGSGALTGAKEGCAEGECGACTVVLNGSAVMSCLVPAAQADGATVVTVEGLGTDNSMHPIQQAFVDEFAVQCGFCIPGFIVAGARLLEDNPIPSDEQIELALSGNLCRCTGYYPIVNAVRRAGEAVVAISPTPGGDGS
jgi:aerobic-type carbon monoxide dehydrogenase small subunit (CoxS/CutS family)